MLSMTKQVTFKTTSLILHSCICIKKLNGLPILPMFFQHRTNLQFNRRKVFRFPSLRHIMLRSTAASFYYWIIIWNFLRCYNRFFYVEIFNFIHIMHPWNWLPLNQFLFVFFLPSYVFRYKLVIDSNCSGTL